MSLSRVFHARCIGATLVISPTGSVSSLAGSRVQSELENVLEQMKAHQIRNVVFDLEQVHYFGSVLLAAMRSVWTRVHGAEGKMVLCRVSPIGREVLRVSHFDSLWPIYSSPIEAVTAVNGMGQGLK